jgi:hypothetical protein
MTIPHLGLIASQLFINMTYLYVTCIVVWCLCECIPGCTYLYLIRGFGFLSTFWRGQKNVLSETVRSLFVVHVFLPYMDLLTIDL